MRTVHSSETPWLLRFTCQRPVREHDQRRPWPVSDSQHSFSCRFYCEEPKFRAIPGYLGVIELLSWNWPPNTTEVLDSDLVCLSTLQDCLPQHVPEFISESYFAGTSLCFCPSLLSMLRNLYYRKMCALCPSCQLVG